MTENEKQPDPEPRQEQPPEMTQKEEKTLDDLLDEIGRKRKKKKQDNS